MPRAKKPPAKRFTAHQITLDPETLSYFHRVLKSNPDLIGLSAAIRFVARRDKARIEGPQTKPEKRTQ